MCIGGHESGIGIPDFLVTKVTPTIGKRKHSVLCILEIRRATKSELVLIDYENRMCEWLARCMFVPKPRQNLKGFLVVGDTYKLFQISASDKTITMSDFRPVATPDNQFTRELCKVALSAWNSI